jgi:hypothetical protein
LSSNGISTTLPSFIATNSNLTDLVLSNNVLKGSIPYSFQLKKWTKLDLSNNKLSGILHQSFWDFDSSASSVSLHNNRLSGSIPQGLQNAKKVNVLENNIFDCTSEILDLPNSDRNKLTYQCGSNLFKIVGIIALFTSFIILIVLLIILKSSFTFNSLRMPEILNKFILRIRYLLFKYDCANDENKNLKNEKTPKLLIFFEFSKQLKKLRFICVSISLTIIVLFMSLYGGLSTKYGKYSHGYVWTVSAPFLSGILPAILISVFSLFFFVVLKLLFNKFDDIKSKSKVVMFMNRLFFGKEKSQEEHKKVTNTNFVYIAKFILVIITNCSIIFVINIFYVYVNLTYSQSIITITQISFGMFKIFWNSFVTAEMIRWTKNDENKIKNNDNNEDCDTANENIYTNKSCDINDNSSNGNRNNQNYINNDKNYIKKNECNNNNNNTNVHKNNVNCNNNNNYDNENLIITIESNNNADNDNISHINNNDNNNNNTQNNVNCNNNNNYANENLIKTIESNNNADNDNISHINNSYDNDNNKNMVNVDQNNVNCNIDNNNDNEDLIITIECDNNADNDNSIHINNIENSNNGNNSNYGDDNKNIGNVNCNNKNIINNIECNSTTDNNNNNIICNDKNNNGNNNDDSKNMCTVNKNNNDIKSFVNTVYNNNDNDKSNISIDNVDDAKKKNFFMKLCFFILYFVGIASLHRHL